jgi:hypothetical protein
VILPDELMAVRMRMLRKCEAGRTATVADQVGPRATILAPNCPPEPSEHPPPPPTLFSLVIAPRNPASWLGGACLAFVTGVVLLLSALSRLSEIVDHIEAATTILIVAPTLVSAYLSVRAANDIAEQLTVTLRRLLGAVGVLTLICAIGLVVQHVPAYGTKGAPPPPPDLRALRWLWTGAAIALLAITAALLFGWRHIDGLNKYAERRAPRQVPDHDLMSVLNPEAAEDGKRVPRVPPPDRWLSTNEGDLVPWGWLHPAQEIDRASPSSVDKYFWTKFCNRPLVGWVQEIFRYDPTR